MTRADRSNPEISRRTEISEALQTYLAEFEAASQVLGSLEEISRFENNGIAATALRELQAGASMVRMLKFALGTSDEMTRQTTIGLERLLSDINTRFRQRAAEQGIEFYLWFDSPIPRWVTTDKDLLLLCLEQLPERAFHLTDQGRVSMKLAMIPASSELSIEISDTGSGMNSISNGDGVKDHGLGLAVLRDILPEKVTLQSIEGVGSKIHVRLPLIEAAPQFIGQMTALPRPKTTENLRTIEHLKRLSGKVSGLVCSRSYRDLFRCIAGNCGITFNLRQTRMQFREMVRSEPADLIIIEGLHEISELISLVREIRACNIQCPILTFTHDSGRDDEDLLKFGVEEVKLPLNLHVLTELFARYLASVESFSNSAAAEAGQPAPQASPCIVTSSVRAVKESLLAEMEPEQAENVSRFFASLPAEIAELERLLKAADVSSGAFMANELGGAACLAGLSGIGEELLAIEKAARQGSKREAAEHLAKAKKLIEDFAGEGTDAEQNKAIARQESSAPTTNAPPISAAHKTAVKQADQSQDCDSRPPIVSSVVTASPELLPLVLEFLNSIDSYFERMEHSISVSHWEALKLVAHEAAGVAGMYGYSDFASTAKRLQNLAVEEQSSEALTTALAELRAIGADMRRGREIMAP